MQILPINSSNLPKIKTPTEALTKELGNAKTRLYQNIFQNKLLPKNQQQFPGKLRHNMTVLNLCESLNIEASNIMAKLTKGMKPELKKQAEDRLRHIANVFQEYLVKQDVNKEILANGIKEILSKIPKVH